jgi:hypothetical protein
MKLISVTAKRYSRKEIRPERLIRRRPAADAVYYGSVLTTYCSELLGSTTPAPTATGTYSQYVWAD